MSEKKRFVNSLFHITKLYKKTNNYKIHKIPVGENVYNMSSYVKNYISVF